MSGTTDFVVHLVVAAVGAWILIWFLRLLAEGIDKAFGGKFKSLPGIKQLNIIFDVLLPLLPCIPAGLIFMLWPANVILDEPLYQFFAGAAAGSISSAIYQLVTREILDKLKGMFSPAHPAASGAPVDKPPADPPAPTVVP